ncbi:unnamed protein product [Cunninghamella echinulata]
MAPKAPASVRTVYSILSDPLIFSATTLTAMMTLGWYVYASKFKRTTRVLDQHMTKQFKLLEKIKINHNTSLYQFALPHSKDVLGLPVGKYISISINIDGKEVVRNYTPTSGNETKGYFDLIIKTYPTGLVSNYISQLEIGDKIDIQGPKGTYSYTPNVMKEIAMIAGGTGLTPMLPIIRSTLRNTQDKTKLTLIYANNTIDDILLKGELDRLERKYSDQFRVHHVLAIPPPTATAITTSSPTSPSKPLLNDYSIGFVTKEVLARWLPSPSKDIQLLLCGPPPMIADVEKFVIELGFDPPKEVSKLTDQVFKF